MILRSIFCLSYFCLVYGNVPKCSELRMGQFYCLHPAIDSLKQQPEGCEANNKAKVTCFPSNGISCSGLTNNSFTRSIPCQYTSGKDFRTALGLSIFFGWLGIDRFYLGYPALGLFKLSTMGFFFIFHLLDIVLIALQIIGPADGTGYRIDYYGPRMYKVEQDDFTYQLNSG